MTTYIPTVAECQTLSWHVKAELSKRLRRQLNQQSRRDRHKRDADLIAQAVRAEAEMWLESIPPDEPELIAERRALWEGR